MSVTWTGLEELKEALRTMPEELTAEAVAEVEDAANGAAASLRAIYGTHVVSGRLRDSVFVSHRAAGKYVAAAIVKVTDPIAWLFDNGSQARHWLRGTKQSTGTMWGKTPPTHVFVKTMIAARRTMYERLKDLLERHGLTVSGDA